MRMATLHDDIQQLDYWCAKEHDWDHDLAGLCMSDPYLDVQNKQ